MRLFRFLILLVPLVLAGCGLSPQQKADYARVESAGVSPAIYDKMVHGDDLSIWDIEALSRAGVSSGIILRYIRDHGTVYYLHTDDVTQMRKAGVDRSVIDYMLRTAQGGWWGYGPYPYAYGPYGPWGPWGPDPFWGPYPGFYGPGYGGVIVIHGGHGAGITRT